MNKADLIEKVADKANVSKKQAEDVLDAFEIVTINALKAKDEVTLTGFGTFSARVRSARMGVNPQNPSEKIQIPEVVVPKFKAGKDLKDSLKEGGSSSAESSSQSSSQE